MSIVNDPVEDGVGDCGFADYGVPSGHGQLGGDDGGPTLITLLEKFEQIEALLVGAPLITLRRVEGKSDHTGLVSAENVDKIVAALKKCGIQFLENGQISEGPGIAVRDAAARSASD